MKRLNRNFPLLAMGMIALVAAILSGLMRFGWEVPVLRSGLGEFHGPLMVSGFLGTLISLERAVALRRGWTYLAPLFTGLGALSLISGVPGHGAPLFGPFLISVGSLVLVGASFLLTRLQPSYHTAVMGLGAVAWFVGNLLWLSGWAVSRLVLWWAGFLVLTITGERLELGRLTRLSRSERMFSLGAVVVFLAGIICATFSAAWGVRLTGAGMMALSHWLARCDIARRTMKQGGLTRYIAICLLSGYVWLGAAGLMALFFGGAQSGPHYDAILHAVFLGFVFAMIFGHAPVIFPVVLGLPVSFRPSFYIHLLLLHITLILRIIGDLSGWLVLRQWGGFLNAVALVIFLLNTGYAIFTGEAARRG